MDVDTGIEPGARKEIAEALARFLADTYTLYLRTHGYHWNVTGPMFNSLHLMFEQQYMDLWAAGDLIAERIRALGFPAPASYGQFARLASISEDDEVPEALEMVRRLVKGHEAAIKTGREVVAAAEAAGDVATTDLATVRIETHEKTAWMLRATAS